MSQPTGIYIRVATSAQEDDISDQYKRAIKYATDILEIDPRNLRIFRDIDTEARTDSSSGYQHLLTLSVNHEIERVIVTDAARLSKDIRDLYGIITRFNRNGVAVHIINADLRIGESEFDTTDRTPLETLETAKDLKASMNSERTKEGIALAQESGTHVGRPPFGFDSDENGGIIPNEDFETALTIIDRIEAGASKRSTAREADTTRATVGNIIDRKQLYFDAANITVKEQTE